MKSAAVYDRFIEVGVFGAVAELLRHYAVSSEALVNGGRLDRLSGRVRQRTIHLLANAGVGRNEIVRLLNLPWSSVAWALRTKRRVRGKVPPRPGRPNPYRKDAADVVEGKRSKGVER